MNTNRITTLAVSMLLTLTAVAQKNEIKAAEKALKKKDYGVALTEISKADGLIGNADAKSQAKYHYIKGMALYAEGSNTDNIDAVITSFNSLKEVEKASGASKYTGEVSLLIDGIIEKLNTSAYASFQEGQKTQDLGKYKKAADGYLKIYQLKPTDTLYLYNSAMINAVGQDFKKSNEQYKELLDLGYTGITTTYTAKSTVNGETMGYNSYKEMMSSVKLKIAEDPKTDISESKYLAMIKAIGSNYVALEDNENALEFIAKARQENPKDYNLIIEEGNIYFKMGNNEKFLEKLNEAIEINPDNPQLHYNVGILNTEVGNNDVAIKEFEKAIELDGSNGDYHNALGNAILSDIDAVQEELDANATNFAKYDKIKEEKLLPIIRKAMPHIEKAYELSKDENIGKQLNSIYENLGMDKRVD